MNTEPIGNYLVGSTARFPTRKLATVLDDPIPTLARHFIASGHVVSFRASLRPYILPFPKTFRQSRKFCRCVDCVVLASVADVACVSTSSASSLHRGKSRVIATHCFLRERITRIRSRERDRTAQFVSLVEEVISRVSTLADTPLAERNLESLTRWARSYEDVSRTSRATS